MKEQVSATLEQHFSDLEDPQVDRTKLHKLLDILVIAICAVIAGADNWEDVEEFGNVRMEQFQACLIGWMSAVSEAMGGQVIALEGKYCSQAGSSSQFGFKPKDEICCHPA